MNLKDRLIKLGSDNPELRKHIRPVLDRISAHGLHLDGDPDVADVTEATLDNLIDALERKMDLDFELSASGVRLPGTVSSAEAFTHGGLLEIHVSMEGPSSKPKVTAVLSQGSAGHPDEEVLVDSVEISNKSRESDIAQMIIRQLQNSRRS
jgi:hypothetical protein